MELLQKEILTKKETEALLSISPQTEIIEDPFSNSGDKLSA